jgi:hypothetical protein
MIILRRSPAWLAFLALAAGACGGEAEDGDEDLVIDDTESALSGPEVSDETDDADENGDRADDGCRDGDHDGHRHHRRHWFRILDLLDGTRDKTITIASLPQGLPDRLIARLHRIDRDDDGVVTKREAKRARRHRR